MSKHAENIEEVLKKIAGFMNLDCSIEIKESESKDNNITTVSVFTPTNAKFLIGKNGQNLQALEHLVRLISTKKSEEQTAIILDVNDYKKTKTSHIIDVAKQAVTRVRNTQKAEALMPMSPQERRVIHMELASYPDVATESIGEGPQRRIVIKPYP